MTEGYIYDPEEVQEELETEEEEVITLADITFSRRTLEDYEEMFTQRLPAIPCTGQEILSAISTIANAYQVAHNCAARLLVVCAKADKDYKIKRDELIAAKIRTIKEANAGKTTKVPAKETLEAIVLAESNELSGLMDSYKKYEVIKSWFETHVKKLGQMLMSAKDISYAVHNGERMYSKGNV